MNCQAGGSCNGGDPAKVLEWANKNGLKHGSCENYTATNLSDHMCEAIDVCRDCVGPPPAVGETGLENCKAVTDTNYYVSEYYKVKGVRQMKAALKDGPISCGIHADDKFENEYDGGIYSEKTLGLINHEISVVGWGVSKDGTEYWIGRNSWGTYWGDYGFFYMQMYKDNLRIEEDCIAGTPTYIKPKTAEEVEFIQ